MLLSGLKGGAGEGRRYSIVKSVSVGGYDMRKWVCWLGEKDKILPVGEMPGGTVTSMIPQAIK